jgi:hypothetical protein
MNMTVISRRNTNSPLPILGGLACGLALASSVSASENVPHRPFAMLAEVPQQGHLTAGLVYEESEAYSIWAGHDKHNIKVKNDGEYYGIDINQGYFAFNYGITDKWAADLNVGATTGAWRSFDANNDAHSTTGLMDWSFGVRYQFLHETNSSSSWTPTLTFRAGAVMPGTYDQHLAFTPGIRSAAIEPEFLLRKHFGWTGFGAYADGLFRWNRTTANDQYILSSGFFQQIKGWEVDLGYRHLQTLSGGDITWNGNNDILYPRDVREISDAIEAGFSYTTSKRHIRYGFHTRAVVDGSNTDDKFWVGGSIDIPFDLGFGR